MASGEKSFILQMVTPDRIIYQQAVLKLNILTSKGEITVLPDHAPLVASIAPGEAKITEKGKDSTRLMAVSEGIVEIKDNFVRLLVSMADRVEELDRSKIEQAKKTAEQMIEKAKKAGAGKREFALWETSLQREIAKLKIIERKKKR